MKVNNQAYRTIWSQDPSTVYIIDQRQLPHRFVIETLTTLDDVAHAIKEMLVRGAGLIGVTASFGMVLATHALTRESLPHATFMQRLAQAGDILKATRPTAVNLEYAVNRQLHALAHVEDAQAKLACAFELAQQMADEDAEMCRAIGQHGVSLIRAISERKQGETVNILTHCNAGWLAFVDYGSATAPIYAAHDSGVKVHVWVDETRPRNQGARLTAWELGQHGVPHTIIADNVGGISCNTGKWIW
jgi:methylthioribose-1-phosphate isomerase